MPSRNVPESSKARKRSAPLPHPVRAPATSWAASYPDSNMSVARFTVVLAGMSDAKDEVCLNSIGSRVGLPPASRNRKKSRRPPATGEAAPRPLTRPSSRFSLLAVPGAHLRPLREETRL